MSQDLKSGNGSKTFSWSSGSSGYPNFPQEIRLIAGETPWETGQHVTTQHVNQYILTELLKHVPYTEPDSEPPPVCEKFELLISSCYELTRPIPIHIFRYEDGSVLINSMELNLYAEGHSEYEARKEFSEVLIYQLEDLHGFLEQGEKLGVDLQTQLRLLERFIKEISSD